MHARSPRSELARAGRAPDVAPGRDGHGAAGVGRAPEYSPVVAADAAEVGVSQGVAAALRRPCPAAPPPARAGGLAMVHHRVSVDVARPGLGRHDQQRDRHYGHGHGTAAAHLPSGHIVVSMSWPIGDV
jgi:hypothetical protein|uniref:Uncharacterized protein n=1 Tax=Zea mays TaxID=4577 RepID=A0A804N8S8_MAIZE